MRAFSLFRVSFDGSLTRREQRRARVAAMLVTCVAVVGAAGGILTVLHMNSDTLSEMANAKPTGDVRMLGTKVAEEKPCDEQTWPFIAGRCLAKTDPAKANERTTPKHGLAAREVALPSATSPKADDSAPQLADRSTAAAAPLAAADMTVGTTGSAPRDNDDGLTSEIPLPQARPQLASLQPVSPDVATPQAVRDDVRDTDRSPLLSRREQRRLDAAERRAAAEERREARRLREEERRESRRRAREEARTARAEARDSFRDRDRDDRIVRRWTEYTYMSPSGRSRRVIVIHQGARGDDFFRTIR